MTVDRQESQTNVIAFFLPTRKPLPVRRRPSSSDRTERRRPSIAGRARRPCRARVAAALTLALGSAGALADVTVAFLGDQGTRQGARDVLALVASEGADLLVSQGDLGYGRGPSVWVANIEEALGEDFPVLAVVGNHEEDDWPEYQRWLERQLERIPDLACDGDVGVKARCTFRGITILQTAPGVREVPGVASHDDYAGYLSRTLANEPNAWRICSWHKNMRDMQIGGKDDSTGWDVYEACREGGGIVATAHEHSYSRTYLMSDFSEKRVVHTDDHLTIGPGQTFAFVSGLGGKSVRPQTHGGPWWAATYSATQGASHGALFCRFGTSRANCWFKDITGAVPDRFTLETRNARAPGSSDTLPPSVPGDEAPQPAPAPSDGLPGPTGLRATPYSSTNGELFWDRAETPGLRYEISRDGRVIGTTDGTSHYERGLDRGRAYRYSVVAIDTRGRRSPAVSVVLDTGAGRGAAATATGTEPGTSAEAERETGAETGTDEAAELSAPTTPVTVTRASTIVSGTPGVRLNVYDRRSYELIWDRVPGATRYRLSSSDGHVVHDGEKVSQYFTGIDASRRVDYRIDAIDPGGRTLATTRVRVAPSESAQLSLID